MADNDSSFRSSCTSSSSDSEFEHSFSFKKKTFQTSPKPVSKARRIIVDDSSPEPSPAAIASKTASLPSPPIDYLSQALTGLKINPPPRMKNSPPLSPTPPSPPGEPDLNWSMQSSSSSRSYYALHASLETSPFLPPKLYTSLFSHQRVGIAWIHDVHNINHDEGYQGGILGDDMGLGKTYQASSYILGMYYRHFVESTTGLDWCAIEADRPHNALIIAPTTLLPVWRKEFATILEQFPDAEFRSIVMCQVLSSTTPKRTSVIASHQTSTSTYNILITTYGLLTSTPALLPDGIKSSWEYVFLDEGHKIKSSNTNVHKSCHLVCLPTTKRLLITGTPVQNNLVELHALVTWVKGESLLGDKKMFKKEYSDTIDRSRNHSATEEEKLRGRLKSKELQEAIQPYLIARDKATIFAHMLPKKSELVIWCEISEEQRSLYSSYILSKDVVDLTSGAVKKSPLVHVTYLKSLSSHPLLLRKESFESDLSNASMSELLEASNKLVILKDVVEHLISKKHRLVIFSTSVKMISIMLRVFPEAMSITGSVVAKKRQQIIDEFNNLKGNILILSTKVGGVGITLTTATRAIIYEPSWNPADDRQAVDRIYRIGQKKPCTIYRFLSSGTVEERMYEKQVFKDGVRRSVMEGGDEEQRYFDKEELKNLFKLGERGRCRVLEEHIPGTHFDNRNKENAGTPRKVPSSPFSKHSSPVRQTGGPKLKTPPPAGSSGNTTILTRHRHVVGVSKHDELYKKGDSGSDSSSGGGRKEGGGTPFAKNNAKNRRKSLAYGANAGKSLFIDLSAKEVSGRSAEEEKKMANLDLEEFGLTVLGRGRGKVCGSKSRQRRETAKDAARGVKGGLQKKKAPAPVVEEVVDSDNDSDADGDALIEMEDLSIEERDAAEIGFEDDVSEEEEFNVGGRSGRTQEDAIELDLFDDVEDDATKMERLYSEGVANERDNNAVGAVDVYLEALELNGDKGKKMEIHRRISYLTDDLGWLSD